MPTRPLVARRHLFETGTLRYFTVRYTDLENFDADLNNPLSDADGLVLYALPTNEEDGTKLVEKTNDRDTANRDEVLIAIPRTIGFYKMPLLNLLTYTGSPKTHLNLKAMQSPDVNFPYG